MAKDALLLAMERFPQPKCHPETRVAAQRVVSHWLCIKGPSASKDIMWLSGAPGVGKSAIAQTVCEALAGKNDPVHAVHFFGRGQGDREKMFFLPATIAYQLCRTTNSRPSIEYAIQMDPDILRQTFEAQFRKLVTDTARGRWRYFQRPLTIVIDGLDECDSVEDQNTLLRLVFEGIATKKMRFLIISRPEQNIHAFFRREDVGRHTIHIRLDEETFSTSQDILTFLRAEFERIRQAKPELCPDLPSGEKWPGEVVIVKLVVDSDAQFIFPKLVIGYIDTVGVLPNQQLRQLVKALCPGAFSKLDLLYYQILSRPLPGVSADSPEFDNYHHNVKGILQVVLAWPKNLSAAGIARVLDLEVDVVQGIILGPLRSLFKFKNGDSNSEITFVHKSLRDHLLDANRSRSFFIPSDQPDAIYLSIISRQSPEDHKVLIGIFGVLIKLPYRWCPLDTVACVLDVDINVVRSVVSGSTRSLFDVDERNERIFPFDDSLKAFLSDQSRSEGFYVPSDELDNLFLRIVSHQQLASVQREFLKGILRAVVVWPSDSCTIDRIAAILGVEFGIIRDAVLGSLRPLFDVEMETNCVGFFNNSFKPFLLDRDRSGEFHVENEDLDRLLLEILSREPSKLIVIELLNAIATWGRMSIDALALMVRIEEPIVRYVLWGPAMRALLDLKSRKESVSFFDLPFVREFLFDRDRSGPFYVPRPLLHRQP